jgi:hypothetical protein
MISVLFVDGTWSRPGVRSVVGEALRRSLDPRVARFEYVDYPAAYGVATSVDGIAYAESVEFGAKALSDAVTATPYPAVVSGYSQGAAAAVAYAREILPRRPLHEVVAVAALGNPHQLVHHGRGGIAGPLNVPRPYWSLYAPGDPIADLPMGSPLRTIADVTDWMSIRDLAASKRWAADILEDIHTRRMQSWWAPWRWGDLASAGQYALNYMGTAHTGDYVTGGHVKRLARMIEGVA